MVSGKEGDRELFQIGDTHIVEVRPEEGKTVKHISVGVGKVFCIHTVRNDEGLYVVIESVIGVLSITHDLIYSFLDVDSSAFQLDLNKGQTVDENCYIIAVCLLTNDRGLMGHLENILRVFLVDECKVHLASIISFQNVFVAQNLCTLKNALAV